MSLLYIWILWAVRRSGGAVTGGSEQSKCSSSCSLIKRNYLQSTFTLIKKLLRVNGKVQQCPVNSRLGTKWRVYYDCYANVPCMANTNPNMVSVNRFQWLKYQPRDCWHSPCSILALPTNPQLMTVSYNSTVYMSWYGVACFSLHQPMLIPEIHHSLFSLWSIRAFLGFFSLSYLLEWLIDWLIIDWELAK